MKAMAFLAVVCLAAVGVGCGNKASDELPRAGSNPAARGGTRRIEFRAAPDPAAADSGILTYINGSIVARIGPGAPDERYETVFFEFEAGSPAGWVEYVDKAEVIDCASGLAVQVEGGAFLKVHFDGATQHGARSPKYLPLEIPGSREPILESKQTCDSAGIVEWVIGLKNMRNFEVEVGIGTPRRVEVRVPR